MTVAAPADVAAWVGLSVDDPRMAPVQRWLDALENQIRMRVADFDERLTDEVYRNRVRDIECVAIERKVRNPDGVSYEAVDNVSLSYRAGAASGVVELLPGEWAELGYGAGIGSLRVNPGAPPYPPPGADWVPLWLS